ncbi:MAG: hypothetical protein H6719_19905 [Sandaracinaceae bacterium]|nr:hypothetical protein [Sandaracinaceae bacterium]
MALGAWLAPGVASACSCVEVSAEGAFDASGAVFEGRVVEVRRPDDPSGALVAVMEVVQHWKGITTERVEVSTPAASSMCGISFEPETSWLVYADPVGDVFTTGLCARTRRIEDAEEDIAFLGAGVVPVEVTDEDEVEPEAADEPPARGGCASCATAPSGPSGVALLAIALGVLVTRRSRTGRGGSGGSRTAGS